MARLIVVRPSWRAGLFVQPVAISRPIEDMFGRSAAVSPVSDAFK